MAAQVSVLGTRDFAFNQQLLVDGQTRELYQSLGVQPEYLGQSFEELRLVDYGANTGIFKKGTANDASFIREPAKFNLLHRAAHDFENLKAVTVLVGPERKAYLVWESFISGVSPCFKNAFNNGFAEAHSDTLTLSSTTPKIFTHFLEWLYSRRLLDSSGNEFAQWWTCEFLLDLYLFADRYIVLRLKQDVLDVFWDKLKNSSFTAAEISAALVKKAYQNLSEKDALLKILVQMFCLHTTLSSIPEEAGNDYPKVFLWRVVLAMNEKRTGGIPLEGECPYSVLGEGLPRKQESSGSSKAFLSLRQKDAPFKMP